MSNDPRIPRSGGSSFCPGVGCPLGGQLCGGGGGPPLRLCVQVAGWCVPVAGLRAPPPPHSGAAAVGVGKSVGFSAAAPQCRGPPLSAPGGSAPAPGFSGGKVARALRCRGKPPLCGAVASGPFPPARRRPAPPWRAPPADASPPGTGRSPGRSAVTDCHASVRTYLAMTCLEGCLHNDSALSGAA